MPEKPHLVYVEWKDATSSAGWRSQRDIDQAHCVTCYSVGWLVKWGKDEITMAATHDSKREPEWNDVQSIPRSCIAHIRRITFKQGKERNERP